MKIPKQPPDTRTAVPMHSALKNKSNPKDIPPDASTPQSPSSQSAGGSGKRVKIPVQRYLDESTGNHKYKGREESVEIGTRQDNGYLRPDPLPGGSKANPELFHTAEAKRKSSQKAANEHLTGGLRPREIEEAEADFRHANKMNEAVARPVKSLEAEIAHLESTPANRDGFIGALLRPLGIEVSDSRSQRLEVAKARLDNARTDLKAISEEMEKQKSVNDKLYDAVVNRRSLEDGQREATGEQGRSKVGANLRFNSHTPGSSPAGSVAEEPRTRRSASLSHLMGRGLPPSALTPQPILNTATAKAEFDISQAAPRAQSQPPPQPSQPIEIPGSGHAPPRQPASEPGPSLGGSQPIDIPRRQGRMSEPPPLRGYDSGGDTFPDRGRSREIRDRRMENSPSPSPDDRIRRGPVHWDPDSISP